MKKKYASSLIVVLLIFLGTNVLMFRCERKPKHMFSGRIVDSKGNPIVGATISQGGVKKSRKAETSKDGKFKLVVEKSDRYVLNITKLGFGLASKIFSDTTSRVEVTMTTATIEEIAPEEQNQIVVLQDTAPTPSEPPSATIIEDSLFSPLDTIPFVFNDKGLLIGFGASPEIGGAYQAAEAFEGQVMGASVELIPDDLEDDPSGAVASFFQNDKKSKKSMITASLSTIDIYSPDGMPGDFTVRNSDGSTGYMVTFGAADINFYRDGQPLQLKKGKFAKLKIPVDTIVLLASGKKISRTIPLFVYDQNTGEWRQDGDNVGVLNKEGTAYEAKISHFSVYNMDIEFMNPSCYRMCNPIASLIPTTAYMEIAGPMGNFHTYPFQSGCTDGCGASINSHVIARMRQDQETGVRFFDGPPPTGRIIASYVFIAGDPSTDVFGTSCSPDNTMCSGGASVTIEWPISLPSYMDPANDGTMIIPITALKVVGTKIRISWVYIPDVMIMGGSRDYTTTTNIPYFIDWSDDPTFGSIDGSVTITPNTEWLNFFDFDLSSITTDPTQSYKFRVRVGPVIDNINSEPSTQCVVPVDGLVLNPC